MHNRFPLEILSPEMDRLRELLESDTPRAGLAGLSGLAASLAVASMCCSYSGRILVVTSDQPTADQLVRELVFCGVENILPFPAWDILPFSAA